MTVDFGLVLQPGWRPLEPADMLTFNRQAVGLLSPAFSALWTEDHFQRLKAYCAEIGRDAGEIAVSVYTHLFLTSDEAEHARLAARLDEAGLFLLGPTSEAAREQLAAYVELGVSHFQVKPYTLATVERFVERVAPEVAV